MVARFAYEDSVGNKSLILTLLPDSTVQKLQAHHHGSGRQVDRHIAPDGDPKARWRLAAL